MLLFNDLFATSGTWMDPGEAAIDMINKQADFCANNGATMELANKITLSIAIRIAAEKFMVLLRRLTSLGLQDMMGLVKPEPTTGGLRTGSQVFPFRSEALCDPYWGYSRYVGSFRLGSRSRPGGRRRRFSGRKVEQVRTIACAGWAGSGGFRLFAC